MYWYCSDLLLSLGCHLSSVCDNTRCQLYTEQSQGSAREENLINVSYFKALCPTAHPHNGLMGQQQQQQQRQNTGQDLWQVLHYWHHIQIDITMTAQHLDIVNHTATERFIFTFFNHLNHANATLPKLNNRVIFNVTSMLL